MALRVLCREVFSVIGVERPVGDSGSWFFAPSHAYYIAGTRLGRSLAETDASGAAWCRVQHGELVVELQRWSRRVLEAVQRFQYDSQLALSEQLSSPTQPLPAQKNSYCFPPV